MKIIVCISVCFASIISFKIVFRLFWSVCTTTYYHSTSPEGNHGPDPSIVSPPQKTRRDFIVLTASMMAGVGVVTGVGWPLINSMNPSAAVLANATVEVDLSKIQEGQSIKVKWRGKPVFIRRRTKAEIKKANSIDYKDMRDPQSDKSRTIKPEWLILIGICTHLGCVPIEQPDSVGGGWLCPCHGSRYDVSGRIVSGPAPRNLEVPSYHFVGDNVVVIGSQANKASA